MWTGSLKLCPHLNILLMDFWKGLRSEITQNKIRSPDPWAWIASVKHLAWVFDSAVRQVLLHQPLSRCFSNYILNTIWYIPYDMVKLIWCLGSSPRCIQIHINCMANQMIWFWCRRNNSPTNVLTLFSESMRHPNCYATDLIWNLAVL